MSCLIMQRDTKLHCSMEAKRNVFIIPLEEAYSRHSFFLYRFDKRALQRPATISHTLIMDFDVISCIKRSTQCGATVQYAFRLLLRYQKRKKKIKRDMQTYLYHFVTNNKLFGEIPFHITASK